MTNYDAWLEAPYQRRYAEGDMPREAEDWMGATIWIEEDDAEGTVESYEAWEDEDEDGRYGGVDLVVNVAGRERNMRPEEVEAAFRAQQARSN